MAKMLTLVFLFATMEASHAVSLHTVTSRQTSQACTCYNWKKAYQHGLYVFPQENGKYVHAECGRGNELYFITKGKHQSDEDLEEIRGAVGRKFCTNFYEKIDNNFCINVNMGADKGQWCYVDSACENLNGGRPVDKKVSWKMCDPSQDKMLRKYQPEDLVALAKSASLDLGLLHKMSYPLIKGGEGTLWKDVSAFWGVGIDHVKRVPKRVPKGIPAELPQLKEFLRSRMSNTTALTTERSKKMQEIMDSGKPYSIDMDNDQHLPHIIVEGKKVYLVLGELVCLSGCDE